MLPLTYSFTPALSADLSEIDSLRIKILTHNTPPARLRSAIAAAEQNEQKYLIKILAAGENASLTPKRLGQYRSSLRPYTETIIELIDRYTGNPTTLSVSDIDGIFYRLSSRLKTRYRVIPYEHEEMVKTLNFIQSSPDHPVVSAALFAAPLLSEPTAQGRMLLGALMTVSLAQKGYAFHRLLTWAPISLTATREETAAITATRQTGNLTEYIAYVVRSIRAELAGLYETLSAPALPTSKRSRLFLTGNEHRLLSLIDHPHRTLTNMEVRKKLKVSQVTAYRTLTHLVSAGILAPHGQGRSVYYTKI